MTIQMIREVAHKVLLGVYPALDMLEYGRYSVDDILDQIVMELIAIDSQLGSERFSASHHRRENDLVEEYYSDDASAHKVSRLVKKVEHYKSVNRNELLRSAGIEKYDPARNSMDGPSNWQNSYQLSETDFHELMMQSTCKLLFKITEHKLSSKTSVPNPLFIELFSEYEGEVERLFELASENEPTNVINATVEYFNLQRQYSIELFYAIASEAGKWNYPKDRYKRAAALCALVPVIPQMDDFPYEIRGAQLRMLMRRNEYVSDIFSLSDEDWAFQKDLIGVACRLTTFIIHYAAGKHFLPMMHEVQSEEKAEFIKERYWLWGQRPHFQWESRKKIQAMRDICDVLTVKLPSPQENS